MPMCRNTLEIHEWTKSVGSPRTPINVMNDRQDCGFAPITTTAKCRLFVVLIEQGFCIMPLCRNAVEIHECPKSVGSPITPINVMNDLQDCGFAPITPIDVMNDLPLLQTTTKRHATTNKATPTCSSLLFLKSTENMRDRGTPC
jgi:hypothetical protein